MTLSWILIFPLTCSMQANRGKAFAKPLSTAPAFRTISELLSRGGFPRSFETHLPRELRTSAFFIRGASPDALSRFLGRQLDGLGKLIQEAAPYHTRWDAQIAPEIRPAAGKLKTVALADLFRHYDFGG